MSAPVISTYGSYNNGEFDVCYGTGFTYATAATTVAATTAPVTLAPAPPPPSPSPEIPRQVSQNKNCSKQHDSVLGFFPQQNLCSSKPLFTSTAADSNTTLVFFSPSLGQRLIPPNICSKNFSVDAGTQIVDCSIYIFSGKFFCLVDANNTASVQPGSILISQAFPDLSIGGPL